MSTKQESDDQKAVLFTIITVVLLAGFGLSVLMGGYIGIKIFGVILCAVTLFVAVVFLFAFLDTISRGK